MSESEHDPYDVCRRVRHYFAKNDYAPTRDQLGVPSEFVDELVRNGVVELRANHEGGPLIYVVLTEKGDRMSRVERDARREDRRRPRSRIRGTGSN